MSATSAVVVIATQSRVVSFSVRAVVVVSMQHVAKTRFDVHRLRAGARLDQRRHRYVLPRHLLTSAS